MLKQLRKRAEGFTIIEVMIVLAIAGLILLIVFLAVPALQRNSRNTQRNSDAANVLGVINEYVNNNNGALPGCVAGPVNNTVTISGGTQTNTATTPPTASTCATPTNSTTANVGGQFGSVTFSALPASPPANPPANTLVIYTSATCTGSAPTPGTPRSFVAWYTNEPSTNQCKSS